MCLNSIFSYPSSSLCTGEVAHAEKTEIVIPTGTRQSETWLVIIDQEANRFKFLFVLLLFHRVQYFVVAAYL